MIDINELKEMLSYDPLDGLFTWHTKKQGQCTITRQY